MLTTIESHQLTRHESDAVHDPVVSWLVRLMAIGQLTLIGVTWKLWTPQTAFPQIPLIRTACNSPSWCDWSCLVILVIASTTLLFLGRWGLASRLATAGIAIALAGLFVLDQHRLQPWAWQFFLLSILLALADDGTARWGWAWLTISIYFWSAISKFDYNFFHDQGPTLVEGFKHAIGIREPANRWSALFNVWVAIGLAIGELSVAILLSFRPTQRIGVWLAILMHGALLVALGPLGLKHSAGVLLWNVFFASQTWLLFRGDSTRRSNNHTGSSDDQRSSLISKWRNGVAAGIILGAMLWPILEPVGGCDHWLAWAVYSARAGQSEILVDSGTWPPNGPVEYDQVFRTIDGVSEVYDRPNVSAWSLKELGVPIYPQFRFQVAVGRDLKHRFQLKDLQVVHWSRNRWNGKPSDVRVVELLMDNNAAPMWNDQPRQSNRE